MKEDLNKIQKLKVITDWHFAMAREARQKAENLLATHSVTDSFDSSIKAKKIAQFTERADFHLSAANLLKTLKVN